MRWMMKKSKRDITKRFRLTDEQAKRLDSYLEKNKFTFTDFTHYLINLSSMKYFSFLASFGKLAYLDLSNKPLQQP